MAFVQARHRYLDSRLRNNLSDWFQASPRCCGRTLST